MIELLELVMHTKQEESEGIIKVVTEYKSQH